MPVTIAVDAMGGDHGPGVTIFIDAPLSSIDVQDALNNLQAGGAEAVAINDRRVITGTVVKQGDNAVLLDGAPTRGPWRFIAIGDKDRLRTTADLMTRLSIWSAACKVYRPSTNSTAPSRNTIARPADPVKPVSQARR